MHEIFTQNCYIICQKYCIGKNSVVNRSNMPFILQNWLKIFPQTTKCYHDNVTADIWQENLTFVKTVDLNDTIKQKEIENKAQNGRKDKRLYTPPVKLEITILINCMQCAFAEHFQGLRCTL